MNRLEYSYFELPSTFYSKVSPLKFKGPSTLLFNKTLSKKLHISEDFIAALIDTTSEVSNEIISH